MSDLITRKYCERHPNKLISQIDNSPGFKGRVNSYGQLCHLCLWEISLRGEECIKANSFIKRLRRFFTG